MRKLRLQNIEFLILLVFLSLIPLSVFVVFPGKQQQRTQFSIINSDSLSSNADSILTTQPSPIKTVFLIVMENENWSDIKKSPSAVYINQNLLPISSYAQNYYNPPNLHPSEPNYLWLESGTNFDVNTDDEPQKNHQSSTKHLTTMLDNDSILWRSYQEDIPGTNCPLFNSGLYAPKHNPMVYFDDVTAGNDSNSTYCISHVRPYEELSRDLNNNSVARYNFITPNLCNDMHNTSGCDNADPIKNGDEWLSKNIPKIINSKSFKDGGVLFVTWDEGENNADGPIGLIALSPFAKGNGYFNTIHYTHSSLLRSIQEIFGLTPLLGDAQNANDLSDLFMPVSATTTKKQLLAKIVSYTPTTSALSPTPKSTPIAIYTPAFRTIPTPTVMTDTDKNVTLTTTWSLYKNATSINNTDFSFAVPDLWHVFYEQNVSSSKLTHTPLLFAFYKPNELGPTQIAGAENRTMSIDLYRPVNSIEAFIEEYLPQYKNKLQVDVYGKMGNKDLYRLSPVSNLPSNDPIYSQFGEHGIVLGTKHAYDIGFNPNISYSLLVDIINTIWPSFRFD